MGLFPFDLQVVFSLPSFLYTSWQTLDAEVTLLQSLGREKENEQTTKGSGIKNKDCSQPLNINLNIYIFNKTSSEFVQITYASECLNKNFDIVKTQNESTVQMII